jgi:hypothetical protein
MRTYIDEVLDEIAEKKGIDIDIISNRTEAFLYVAYFDKEITKVIKF